MQLDRRKGKWTTGCHWAPGGPWRLCPPAPSLPSVPRPRPSDTLLSSPTGPLTLLRTCQACSGLRPSAGAPSAPPLVDPFLSVTQTTTQVDSLPAVKLSPQRWHQGRVSFPSFTPRVSGIGSAGTCGINDRTTAFSAAALGCTLNSGAQGPRPTQEAVCAGRDPQDARPRCQAVTLSLSGLAPGAVSKDPAAAYERPEQAHPREERGRSSHPHGTPGAPRRPGHSGACHPGQGTSGPRCCTTWEAPPREQCPRDAVQALPCKQIAERSEARGPLGTDESAGGGMQF